MTRRSGAPRTRCSPPSPTNRKEPMSDDLTPAQHAFFDRPDRPRIVCLCGSTRYWRTFQQANLRETMAGRIVLSIGAASGTDDEHFGNLPKADYDRTKAQLDELHLRKIDLADEVYILNRDDYLGDSTRRELAYARAKGKHIRWWQPTDHNLPGEWLG